MSVSLVKETGRHAYRSLRPSVIVAADYGIVFRDSLPVASTRVRGGGIGRHSTDGAAEQSPVVFVSARGTVIRKVAGQDDVMVDGPTAHDWTLVAV